MVVPDWVIALLQLLGLKDSPAKVNTQEIAKLENELRNIRKQIDKNNDEISSFQIELNELINEKNRLMENYKKATDETQRKILATNFETAQKKIESIRLSIDEKQNNNNLRFNEEKATIKILEEMKGPEIEVLERTADKVEQANENNEDKNAIGKSLSNMTKEKESTGPSAIEQALAAEIAKESSASASAIEAAIAEAEKNKTENTIEQ